MAKSANSQPPPEPKAQAQRGLSDPAPDFLGIRMLKASDMVAAHIRGQIIRGELTEGDFLPTEAQLAEHFATSRPTLREAIRVLESEQLITIKRGSRSGAQVHRPRVDNVARYAGFALQADGATLGDIYEARLGIEPFAAGLASQRRSAEDIAGLRAAFAVLTQLMKAGELKEYRLGIARFHLSVVDAAQNMTLSLMSRLLHMVIEKHQARFRETVSVVGSLTGSARAEFYRSGMASLEKIIDIIEAGDRPGAEAHWRALIEHGNEVWLSGYDRTAVIDLLD